MFEKKQVRRNLRRLQYIKTWQLVILLVLAGFMSATLLRLNNIGMVERRGAVMSADEAGDGQVIQDRLYDLQRYVSAHMNTGMGQGLYLEASYKRDIQAAYARVSKGSNPNGNIYKKAQEVCAPRFSSYSTAYLQCTTSELEKYPASKELISSVQLSPSLYRHAFVSPVWTPDFAGWSVLICVVIFIMILARLTGVIILKIMLHNHQKSI